MSLPPTSSKFVGPMAESISLKDFEPVYDADKTVEISNCPREPIAHSTTTNFFSFVFGFIIIVMMSVMMTRVVGGIATGITRGGPNDDLAQGDS